MRFGRIFDWHTPFDIYVHILYIHIHIQKCTV